MANKAYKVRLYPTTLQKQRIDITISCSRFIYNQTLAERIDIYNALKDNKAKLRNHKYKTEKDYKKEFPFLKEASSRALQQARRDLDIAFKNFFKGIKKKGKIGFPKFKSKKQSKWSYREPQVSNCITIKHNKIKLLKLGWVKLRGLSEDFSGNIKSVTITKDRDGKYYASILVEKTITKRNRIVNNIIGIDLGLKSLIVCSNGMAINSIKAKLQEITKKIDKVNKSLSRKQYGSNNYNKTRSRIVRLYKKRTNMQSHFFWHIANKLCSENQVIAIENLNVKGLIRNRRLSKAIQASSWGKLVIMIKQKALEYDTTIFEVNMFYPSSKTCSKCKNYKDDLKLSDRTYICNSCNLEIDRDLNAAINIQNNYISSESGDYRCGEVTSTVSKYLNFDLASNFVEALPSS